MYVKSLWGDEGVGCGGGRLSQGRPSLLIDPSIRKGQRKGKRRLNLHLLVYLQFRPQSF